MSVTEITSDDLFEPALHNAGDKLVVVDFFATWCAPCHKIAPFVDQLPTKYPKVVFLKVDVDKCQETAMTNEIEAMPTFMFFRNKVKLDSMSGANKDELEEKIKKLLGEKSAEPSAVKGHSEGSDAGGGSADASAGKGSRRSSKANSADEKASAEKASKGSAKANSVDEKGSVSQGSNKPETGEEKKPETPTADAEAGESKEKKDDAEALKNEEPPEPAKEKPSKPKVAAKKNSRTSKSSIVKADAPEGQKQAAAGPGQPKRLSAGQPKSSERKTSQLSTGQQKERKTSALSANTPKGSQSAGLAQGKAGSKSPSPKPKPKTGNK